MLFETRSTSRWAVGKELKAAKKGDSRPSTGIRAERETCNLQANKDGGSDDEKFVRDKKSAHGHDARFCGINYDLRLGFAQWTPIEAGASRLIYGIFIDFFSMSPNSNRLRAACHSRTVNVKGLKLVITDK